MINKPSIMAVSRREEKRRKQRLPDFMKKGNRERKQMQAPLVENEVTFDEVDDVGHEDVQQRLPSFDHLNPGGTYIASSIQHGVYSGFSANYGIVQNGTGRRAGVWTRKQVFGVDENTERGNWTGRFEYLLSMLGFAVGLGNVWRFPYLCYSYGGGAFLFPYLLFMALVGIPLFFLESALGQFTSSGPTTCWNFAPLLQGIGIAMMISSFIISTYYCMIIAWCHFYLFASFTSSLPWADCEGNWTTEDCSLKLPDVTCDTHNYTQYPNGTCYAQNVFIGLWNYDIFKNVTGRERLAPTRQYWEKYVLGLSDGIEETGAPQWRLVLCLLFSWTLVFLCLIKGIKSAGKVVYFTAVFPYIVLLILFFRGITLEGALTGIKFYITPKFAKLKDVAIWQAAAVQIFYSLGTCGGGIVALSSYNRFHNNILRDSLIVSLSNCMTSIFAGFVIFSYVGHMAYNLDVGVEDVADSGPGLAFVVYPEAVQNLPAPTFWSIMFFFMLVTLGLDSQFASVEALLTSVLDSFPSKRKWKTLLIFVICAILFLLGLPYTTKSGIYWVTLIDYYAAAWGVLLTGLFEVIAVAYVYGVERFCSDIETMIGPWWPLFWKLCWYCFTPVGTAFILLLSWIKHEPIQYFNYKYPAWAEGLGWMVSFTAITAVPVVICYKIVTYPSSKSITEKIKALIVPTRDWGPALVKHRQLIQHVGGFVVDPQQDLHHAEIPYSNISNGNVTRVSEITVHETAA